MPPANESPDAFRSLMTIDISISVSVGSDDVVTTVESVVVDVVVSAVVTDAGVSEVVDSEEVADVASVTVLVDVDSGAGDAVPGEGCLMLVGSSSVAESSFPSPPQPVQKANINNVLARYSKVLPRS